MITIEDLVEKYVWWSHNTENFKCDIEGNNEALKKAEKFRQYAIVKLQVKGKDFDRLVREYEKRKAIKTKEQLSGVWESEVQEDRERNEVQ